MDYFDANFLNFYTTMTQNCPYDSYNYYQVPVESNIEHQIDMEMNAMKNTYNIEECAYVEEMLAKHPVVVERRKLPLEEDRSSESLQRAESCRKSRINNKIKKAKMRFRHEFASQRRKQSAELLSHLQNLVAEAEMQLLYNGFSQKKLQYLREQFAMDRPQSPPLSWSS